jgi:hypothetical protein
LYLKILFFYRGCPFNCGGAELINIAFSSSLQDPFTRLQPNPIFPNGNEDPFIWQDARGNWHLLLHSLESGRCIRYSSIDSHLSFLPSTVLITSLVLYKVGDLEDLR